MIAQQMEPIVIDVRGMAPAPQGSKRHVGRGVMIESCKQVKPWRTLVTQTAVEVGASPIKGAVTMDVEFIFPRPKSHFRANGDIKPNAPYLHSVKPDVSKLIRSTEDALSAVAFEDDARIGQTFAIKRYAGDGELPGAVIVVSPATFQPIV